MAGEPRFSLVATPGGMGGGNGPFWTAVRLGIYEQHGIEVSVKRVSGGSGGLARALDSGDIHFANLGASSIVRFDLDGADLVAVMGLAGKCMYQVMTTPDVKRVEDLRGRTLAANPESTDLVLWHWFLPQHGLDPERDVSFRAITHNDDQMDALRRGEVAAITLSPAGSTYLRKEGFSELVDFSAQDVDFAVGCVVTTRRLLREHPDEALAFVRASVDATRRYNQDRDLALRILRDYTRIEDEEVLDHTYQVFHRGAQRWPYPSEEGFEAVIRTMERLDSRARGKVPADFTDRRPLDKLRQREESTQEEGE